MSLKNTWKNKVDGVDDVRAEDINSIAEAVIGLEENGTGESEDGFSPIATITQTENGAEISITDVNGTTTATISNGKDGANGTNGQDGKDGYTPIKGKDYWTEEDKTEIVNDVLEALPTAEGVMF